MKLEKIYFMGLVALSAFGFTACANQMAESERWNYTEDDCMDFISENGYLIEEDNTSKLYTKLDYPLYNDSLSKEDVIVFDYTKLDDDYNSGALSCDYVSYDILSKYKVNITDFDLDEDNYGYFSATFEGVENDTYCALVNKSAVSLNRYVYIEGSLVDETGNGDEISFDDLIVDSAESDDLSSGQIKDIVNIVSGVLNAGMGIVADDYKLTLNGVVSIVSSAFGLGYADNTSNKQIYNKVAETENKVAALSKAISANQTELMGEFAKTDIGVDRTSLYTLQNTANNFFNNYVEKINRYLDDYKDEEYIFIKNFIKNNQTIDVYYNLNSENKFVPCLKEDFDKVNGTIYSYDITTFTKSASFITDHNGIEDGFVDALYEDFKTNIGDASVPTFRTEEELFSDMFHRIEEESLIAYYTNNLERAQYVRDLTVNFADNISGNGTTSILEVYADCLKYTYNFASEVKTTYAGICSNLDLLLCQIGAMADRACAYNEISKDNIKNLNSSFTSAISSIKKEKDTMSNLADNYCFVTDTTIESTYVKTTYKAESGYYNGAYMTEYLRSGNETKTNELVIMDKTFISDNKSYTMLASTDMERMNARYDVITSLLKKNNEKYAANFFTYLADKGVIKAGAINEYKNRGSLSSDAKFATDFNERQMDVTDTVSLTCTNNKDKGSWFSVGSQYKYGDKGIKGKATTAYWHGNLLEADYITYSGAISKQVSCAYAQYYQKGFVHHQEIYTFDYDSYCFIIYNN